MPNFWQRLQKGAVSSHRTLRSLHVIHPFLLLPRTILRRFVRISNSWVILSSYLALLCKWVCIWKEGELKLDEGSHLTWAAWVKLTFVVPPFDSRARKIWPMREASEKDKTSSAWNTSFQQLNIYEEIFTFVKVSNREKFFSNWGYVWTPRLALGRGSPRTR